MRVLKILSVAAVGSFLSVGCSTVQKNGAEEKLALQNRLAEMQTQLQQQNTQIEGLEVKLSTLNHRLSEAEAEKPSRSGLKTTSVSPHPAQGAGSEVEAVPAPNDPEAGMISDAAVGSYRQGRILFQAGKFPEAILAFSAFLERYPEHPLAGSAQFHMGESYFRQSEFQLAVQEYQRVLAQYPLSPRISDTLAQLAAAEEVLKKPEEAARHRQMLAALFPQSPAAREQQNAKAPGAADTVKTPAAAPESAPTPPGFLDEPPATAPGAAQ